MTRYTGQTVKFHRLGRLSHHPWRVIDSICTIGSKGTHLKLEGGGRTITVPLRWKPKFFEFNGKDGK